MFISAPLHYPVHQKPVQSPSPRFGCRMFAYMAAKRYREQEEFVRQCLSYGSNSLLKLAEKGSEAIEPTGDMSWEHLTNNGKQQDGWGIAAFAKRHVPKIAKSPLSAHLDSAYLKAIEQTIQSQAQTFLAHIRNGRHPQISNSHPFRFGRFSLMHNGTVPPNTSKYVEAQVKRYHKLYRHPLPKGTTDSERVFLYMMGKLRERTGTTDTRKLSTAQVEAVFSEVVSELIRLSSTLDKPAQKTVKQRFEQLSGASLSPGTKLQVPVGLNFILSDGERTFASCFGHPLHLGTRLSKTGDLQEVMLASRKTQPEPKSGQGRIRWWELPSGNMVTLERLAGELRVAFRPLVGQTRK